MTQSTTSTVATTGTNPRIATVQRTTRETTITCTLSLDGTGEADVQTGISFFDHMLVALARHARFDLSLSCKGDLHVDDHHSVEDCAIVLGTAIDKALGERAGFVRFGHAYAPLDESLARAVVDVSGRGGCVAQLGLTRERVGALSCENVPHFFASLASAMRATLHVDVLRGENDHHRIEASFKALALALRAALARDGSLAVPSTKGSL
jgi:imidazoleglycerol phosphate dehydratase HisB